MNNICQKDCNCNKHFHSIEEIQQHADWLGIPGPNVEEHDNDYDGECFCKLCISYF